MAYLHHFYHSNKSQLLPKQWQKILPQGNKTYIYNYLDQDPLHFKLNVESLFHDTHLNFTNLKICGTMSFKMRRYHVRYLIQKAKSWPRNITLQFTKYMHIYTKSHVCACVCVCVWCGGGWLFNIDDAMANFQFLTAFRVSSALKYIIYDFHIFFILKIFY